MDQVVLGHVDGLADGTLTGWVANIHEPGRAEDVICEDARGRRVAFRAWHAREDVRTFLGLDGRFGFAIPVAALGGLDRVITVRTRAGDVLGNGEDVALPPAGADTPSREAAAIVVLHIPKTAGTSLRTSLIAGLAPSERLFVYAPPFGLSPGELACLPAAQKRAASLVIGHAMFGIGALLGRAVRYATFLRDPDARLRSHLAHHLAAGTVFHVDGREDSLLDVFDAGASEEFDNLMVRSVAGLPDSIVPLGGIDENAVDLAMHNIATHFAMVGTVETMDADMRRLGAVLGRDVAQPGRENTRAATPDYAALERCVDWERVLERNRFDAMLMQRVRDLQGG